jgi:hypothetical protein
MPPKCALCRRRDRHAVPRRDHLAALHTGGSPRRRVGSGFRSFRWRCRLAAKRHGRAIPPIPDVVAAARRRSAAQPMPLMRIVSLARGCAAVCPCHSPPSRRTGAPDGEMWLYAHGSSAASRCMRAVASALCTPHRPSADIGASPVPSLLPAYACVACNVMHVRRMCGYPCVRWAQSQVSAWAAPFPFYPSDVAVVSTR